MNELYKIDLIEELKKMAKSSSEKAKLILDIDKILIEQYSNFNYLKIYEDYLYCLCILTATYEGVKKGSSFYAFFVNDSTIEKFLISLGLKYVKVRRKNCYEFLISKDEEHLKLYEKISLSNGNKREYYHLCGTFFDYPKCCVENFVDKATNGENIGVKFSENLYKSNSNNIDKNLLFAACFFVPCSTNCGNAIEKGEEIFEALERNYGKRFAEKASKDLVNLLFERLIK